MKFQRIDSSPNSSTVLSADDIAKANRFEERRARLDAERNSPTIDPAMRRRVVALYGQLSASMAMVDKRRPKNKWEREPAKALTIEEMAELWGKNPVKLSAEALARPLEYSHASISPNSGPAEGL